MHALGVRIGRGLSAGALLVLTGPLGAGKTTLSRGIGEGLGVRGPVTSPTFVLARTHPSLVGGAPLVHVDAYRLSDPLQLDDLDIAFDSSVVLMEWGADAAAAVASEWTELVITRPTGSDADRGDGAGQGDDADAEALAGDAPRTVLVRRVEAGSRR
ncbi:tRNA (adenosine(37)-N6)-threonylcarbamoyltransferase complex ATPase subunit type 1 TsaE [Mycetocola reblochoni]|nr:tRNA (adenosine(37)-N6)-threonylcarbamoyltransferase complex ATPase subunit type 1 TsaE [Mycetocola reblochoni]RLP69330.1 tRNA (adenosine(37)-N6)-threonylcarbamoyltransferase complex ATPase subunit type 1 TsaE [Mycetocola reblochoni]